MRVRLVWLLLAVAWSGTGHAQELTGAERQRLLETARGRYYNLTGLGVRAFTCAVNFDLDTISKGLLPETDVLDRALLRRAVFEVKVTPGGPSMRHEFPQGSVSQSQEVVAGVTLWIEELVQGFFATWPGKGLSGVIPPDRQVDEVTREGDGFRISVQGPHGLGRRELRLDRELLLKTIVSGGGAIQERPVFEATPDGLVFSGSETADREPGGVTQVRYAIEQGMVSGVRLPRSVHLVVGEHVDVRFALSGCRVARR